MAKGIPLMGRGPDGKAKMINVDENGNVKVQQSGLMVEYLDMTHQTTSSQYYGLTVEVTLDNIKPFPIGDSKKVTIMLNNRTTRGASGHHVRFYNTDQKIDPINYLGSSKLFTPAAGEKIIVDLNDLVDEANPMPDGTLGIVLTVGNYYNYGQYDVIISKALR